MREREGDIHGEGDFHGEGGRREGGREGERERVCVGRSEWARHLNCLGGEGAHTNLVSGFGCSILGYGCMVLDLWFMVHGSWFMIQG